MSGAARLDQAYGLQNRIGMKGLAKKASLLGFDPSLEIPIDFFAADHYERKAGKAFQNFVQHFRAASRRDDHVEQHHVDDIGVLGEKLPGLIAVLSGNYPMPCSRQNASEQAQNLAFIVHQENRQPHLGSENTG